MAKKWKRICIITLATAFALVGVYLSLFLFWRDLRVSQYEITSAKISEPLRMAVVADLHSEVFKDNALIALLAEQQPDVLLLPGDIFDDVVPDDGAIAFLEEAVLRWPVYYVTGNHEYWSYRTAEMTGIVESLGAQVLSDGYTTINIRGNRLVIAGIEDPSRRRYGYPDYDQQSSMQSVFEALRAESAYKILLAHRPEYVDDYLPYGFDLVVSGHTHGGQVIIPGLVNGLFAPNQGSLPEYAGGLYELGESTMIVSRGIANNVKYPRVFNPPEVVVIDVLPLRK